ncbi:Uncharacterised protein [Mycobacteroides abscessus subsp. abscessus]|nr:Uncharacterised protein [Mycobacteroides abscessus subsp. abscessus]
MSRTDGDGAGRVSRIGDGGQLAIDTGLWSDDAAAEAAGVGAGPHVSGADHRDHSGVGQQVQLSA